MPSACVLGEGDEVLARFDCPSTSTAFVAAAARAAQDAAACLAGTRPVGDASAVAESLATDGLTAAERAAIGFPSHPGDGGPLTDQTAPQASGRGSISLVTAKVRQLSDFATGSPSDVGRGEATTPAAPASPAAAVATTEPTPSRFVSATPMDPPTLPHAAPSSWPAEAPSRNSAFTNALHPAVVAPGHRAELGGNAVAGRLADGGGSSTRGPARIIGDRLGPAGEAEIDQHVVVVRHRVPKAVQHLLEAHHAC